MPVGDRDRTVNVGFASPGGEVWVPREPDEEPIVPLAQQALRGAPSPCPAREPVAIGQVFGPPLVLWPTERPWESPEFIAAVREAEREEAERGNEHVPTLRSARPSRGASSSAGPTHTLLRPAYGLLSSPGRHQKRVRIFLRWRKVVAELARLRRLRRLTRALTAYLRRRGGGLRWSPRSRLLAEDIAVLPLFLRRVFSRWASRARFVQDRFSDGRRRRPVVFPARRSWWRRALRWLEDESLRAVAFRVVARLLRWAVSGRGAGPVGAALGAAGTAVLLLEGPAGAGLTEGDAAAAALAPVVHA